MDEREGGEGWQKTAEDWVVLFPLSKASVFGQNSVLNYYQYLAQSSVPSADVIHVISKEERLK